MVSEPSKRRRALAKTFGAENVFDPLNSDLAQECKAAAGVQGVQVVFDCAGVSSAFDSALSVMQRKAIFVTIAMWSPDRPATFDPTILMAKEIILTGTPQSRPDQKVIIKESDILPSTHSIRDAAGAMAYTPQDFRDVIAALAEGLLQTEGLITSVLPLEKVVEEGYSSIKSNPDEHVKVLVRM